ncbi:MAG: beta galactosidase jelly roll domain-containing protein [Ignavibacteriae bacterium]|nr:beta galactosidase jelly roll domain-containing protein [Ignavibacteriota bacterium]
MPKMSLNGKWNYIEDSNSNFTFSKINKLFQSEKTNVMELPINWELAGLHNFSGSVWFQKSFRINKKKLDETLSILKFKGVDYFADIWLNGKFLENHEGYFQTFYFDVTNKLKFNETNILTVKVNSPNEEPGKVWPLKKQLIKGIFNHHDCRPGAWSLEYGQDQNTGGIWNDVELFFNEKIFIENTKISTHLSQDFKSAKIQVEISYKSNLNSPVKPKISFTAIDSKKRKTEYFQEIFIQPNQSIVNIIFEISNPILWWSWDLGKPELYDLDINIHKFISFSEKFAVRKIFLDSQCRFFLNDKELFLRGTNIIPTQFLSELKNERIAKIVNLIKEANINIVRIHAHVNRKELYDEFDRIGILLWQDFALQWTYDESEKFAANAVCQIKEMVNQFYNHPSIAFWCCHNEPGEQINSLDKLLYNAVQSEDQSRIIRLASNYEEHPYDGWYWGNKEHFAAAPMGPLVTEFGAQGLPNKNSLEKFIPENKLFPPDIEFWKYHDFQPDTTYNIAKVQTGKNIDEFIENSQNYQSELLRTAIHFYRRKKNEGITGIFQFMFVDCWPSITWSVIDYYLEKKNGFNTLKECYEPILLSVNLRQDQYFKESKINFDFHIINDTYNEIMNCLLEILIDKKNIGNVTDLNVYPNSIIFKHFESMNIKFPNWVDIGKHEIIFQLKNKSKIISQNKFSINIIKM